jgi:hypothetical protein
MTRKTKPAEGDEGKLSRATGMQFSEDPGAAVRFTASHRLANEGASGLGALPHRGCLRRSLHAVPGKSPRGLDP